MNCFFYLILIIWIGIGWFGCFVNYLAAQKEKKQMIQMMLVFYLMAGALGGIFIWIGVIGQEIENG